MVTFDWRIEPGTIIGRHIMGAIELSSVIRSTSPRSSHLKRLFGGYLWHSLSASCSPGNSGVVAAPDAGAAVVAGATGGAVPPRDTVGGAAVRTCAETDDASSRTIEMEANRVNFVLIGIGSSNVRARPCRSPDRIVERNGFTAP